METDASKDTNKEFKVTVGAGGGDEKLDIRQEVIEKEPPHPGHPEPEKEPEIVDAENLDDILAHAETTKEDSLVYNNKRYKYKYRDIPWEKYSEIIEKIARNPNIHVKMRERAEQMEELRFRIVSILGQPFSIQLIVQIGKDFGEALRIHMFGTNGINRFDEQIMGELTENLKPEMNRLIEQGQKQKNRGMSI